MYSDPNKSRSISARARAQRAQLYSQLMKNCGIANASILDMGGTVDYWKMNLAHISPGLINEIDVVNICPQDTRNESIGNVLLHVYEGNALERRFLRLDHYDVVFSNSVIEHVGNLRMQHSFAKIVQEVGTYYFIQTPAKSFPLEPHFYFPFFPYLPLGIRTFLHRNMKLGFMRREENWLAARIACEETRLLTKRELESIFFNCNVIRERLLWMTKSYVATNMCLSKEKATLRQDSSEQTNR